MNSLTSFTYHVTAEGVRLSYTYSDISDAGEVLESSKRKSMVVLPTQENTEILQSLNIIKDYLNQKLPE